MLKFNPPVIAHRGASAYAPENTLAAFTKAAQLGVKWVEFDVMLSSCGRPVIFHDETLERTTNAEGELSQFSYDYLRTLDAGAWFDPRFSGERIPSLAQVLAFLKDQQMAANIEIKAQPGQEELFIKQLLPIVTSCFSLTNEAILFSSFSIEALQCLRQQAPDCQMGLLLQAWEAHWEKDAAALHCASIHVNEAILTPAAAQHIKGMNKALLCYTVNSASRAQELYAWGVDAVFSDVPDIIVRG